MIRLDRLPAVAGLIALLASCTGDSVAPTPRGPALAWRDGAHGENGNPDFFFLPPIFKDPSADSDYEPAAFNADVRPAVEIWVLGSPDAEGNREPDALFTRFEPEMVTLNTTDQLYHVNWDTRNPDVNPASWYRIRVLIGTFELGFVDVDPVSSGSGLKLVTGDYIGLVDGRTLPIKFRIEDGALCGDATSPCNAATIDLATGGNVELVLEDASGDIKEIFDVTVEAGTTAEFGGEAVTDVTINIEECTDGGIDLDLRRFGSCLQVTTFFTETGEGGRELELSNPLSEFPLVISTCRLEGSPELEGMSEAEEKLITLHQQDGLTVRALSHVSPNCTEITRLKAPPTSFAQRGLRRLGDLASRLFLPQTLHAGSRSAVINLGAGGGTRILGTDCTTAPTPTSRGMLFAECATDPASAPNLAAAAVVASAKTTSKFQFFQPAIMQGVDGTSGQTALVDQAVAQPPAVFVEDAQGLETPVPVTQAFVTFKVISGGGNFGMDGTTPITEVRVPINTDGFAAAPRWILGSVPGLNVVRASGKGIAARPGDSKPFIPAVFGTNDAVELPTPTDAHYVEFTATGTQPLLTGYEIVSSDAFRLAAGGGFARGTAECPAGKVVIAGGAQVVGEGSADFNTRMQESAPGTVGGGATSLWLASVKNEDEGAHDVRIFAICANRPRGYEIVATSSFTLAGSGGFVRETANCPAGKVVLGGGAQVVGEGAGNFNTRLQESGPSTVGGGAISLHLAAIKNEDEGAHAVQIFAVCANPVSGYEVVATPSFSLGAAGGFNRASADCPAGKVVVGGGAQVVGEGTADFNTRLQETVPGTFGGGETSVWLVSIKNLATVGHTAAIRAVCVDGA